MKIWLSILLVAVITAAWAIPGRCEWQTYTVADGLAGNSVRVITEDSNGNLWFGTDDGVSRYDGANWTTYTTEDGLPHNAVGAILEDSNGNLWFGGGGGVSRYDGVNWTTYTMVAGLAYVYAITEDSNGNLWFGTWGGGVSRYDGVNWTTYTTEDGLADNLVTAIAEDSNGDLWFGTYGGGVSRYDGANWTTYTEADGLADNRVAAITEDSNGDLWFGTRGGVSRYDGVNWTTYTTEDGLADNTVYAITEDSHGNLWFGTDDRYGYGVSRYDGVNWTTYTREDGLAYYDVMAILEDSNGNLWFGTDGGVSRYDGVNWTTYTEADVLADNRVAAIVEDSNGNLWFGTDDGVSRYDGANWTTYTTEDGLPHNAVGAILEDSNGNLWFGTYGYGVSRYDGVSWTTYTTADGLAYGSVKAIIEDSHGNLWFGTYGGGVSRYDGVNWTTYTEEDGLADNSVSAIVEDTNGDLWFGTRRNGVSRYDGVNWTTYTEADGLANNGVSVIIEDSHGNLWFGGGWVSRYDGVNWTTFTEADGLVNIHVRAIMEDSNGDLWFGTMNGVSRYDGVNWTTYTTEDGLASNGVGEITEDSNGNLWFGTSWGVTLHEPDRVGPHTVIWPRPPQLSPNTIQAIAFSAAFGEVGGITFSYSMDGSAWSEWSSVNSWTASGLFDGEHIFRVRARDKLENVDSTPAVCVFEIDATPPRPVIEFPAYGQAVRDSVLIRGSAADLRFKRYRVEVRPSGAAVWGSLIESSSPVTKGALCTWDTSSLPDGDYELRLSVADTLGLTGTALVGVTVDNHEPWADETSPAVASSAAGGDIYTTDEEVHLYFPPRSFTRDTEVVITALAESEVPDTLADGARRVLAGYKISWGSISLEKAATLDLSYAEASPEPDGRPVLHFFGADSTWQRLGGTVDVSARRISSSFTEPGRYSVFAELTGVSGTSTLSALAVTPRAFSPHGSFASDEAAISFTLGRSGAVTVKVYNRAGRLVRKIVSGKSMGAGANLVRWDGRDGNGQMVEDGLYLVSVEALGQTQVKTLGVVR